MLPYIAYMDPMGYYMTYLAGAGESPLRSGGVLGRTLAPKELVGPVVGQRR